MGRLVHQNFLKAQTTNQPHKELPMLVISSLKIGGGGKTASTLSISKELSAKGIRHGILCLDLRKRLSKNEVIRKITSDTPYKHASDEACYLAQNVNQNFSSVFICKRRDLAWIELSKEQTFKLLLSDDGWEDPRISKACFLRILSPEEKIKPSRSDLFPQSNYRSLLEQHSPPFLTLSFNQASATYPPDLSIQNSPPINSNGQTLEDLTKVVLILAVGDSSRVLESIKKQGVLPPQKIILKDHSGNFQKEVDKALQRGHLVLTSLKDIARLDKNLQKHPSIYGLQYSLKLNYPINQLLERADVKL